MSVEKCKKHPKYNGKKEPSYKVPCLVCMSLYLALHKKPRVLPMPTRIIVNKKKYNRKKYRKDKG